MSWGQEDRGAKNSLLISQFCSDRHLFQSAEPNPSFALILITSPVNGDSTHVEENKNLAVFVNTFSS